MQGPCYLNPTTNPISITAYNFESRSQISDSFRLVLLRSKSQISEVICPVWHIQNSDFLKVCSLSMLGGFGLGRELVRGGGGDSYIPPPPIKLNDIGVILRIFSRVFCQNNIAKIKYLSIWTKFMGNFEFRKWSFLRIQNSNTKFSDSVNNTGFYCEWLKLFWNRS